jgi:sulfatase maturation enzyme AslB (radical SAM superfamily)
MAYKVSIISKIKRAMNFHRLRLKFIGERMIGHEFVPVNKRITIEPSGYCNLACKFCAYRKKDLGHVIMPNEDFANYVDQATQLGFKNFSLTSSSGEIFFDKGADWKLDYLDNHPKVGSYGFYTNFILPDEQMIDKIFTLKKIGWLNFSIYGHDFESFTRITEKSRKQYNKLVKNINRLADHPSAGQNLMEFHIRTDRNFTWHPNDGVDENSSELIKAIYWAVTKCGVKWLDNYLLYDNWGGMINDKDVADLDIELSDGSLQPKVGACILLFDEPMIFADGAVNACACRGIDRSLQIGDLKKSSLSQVLSSDNTVYRDIINRHQKNDFPETCKDCTIYRSVYRKPRGWPYTSISEFFKKHNERAVKN